MAKSQIGSSIVRNNLMKLPLEYSNLNKKIHGNNKASKAA
jgi:hypothetical protein